MTHAALPHKDDFDLAVEEGWLVSKPCPLGRPLTLYTYTAETQWQRHWTPVTTAARGLVLHDDGHAVARPFDKFFNLGEAESTKPEVLPASVPQLAEKYDGSLIIVFADSTEGSREHWRAVTRGSWESPQAQRAQQWLDASEHLRRVLAPGTTYMFEYCSPSNRIVVPYANEQFVLLGRRHPDGNVDDYEMARRVGEALADFAPLLTPLSYVERPLASFNAAASLADSAEGFVALWPEHGLRVKLKYDEYKRLHRLLTEFSRKALWECMATGAAMPDLKRVPDDFRQWFKTERDELQARFDATAAAAFGTILAGRKRQEIERKAFAAAVEKFPLNLHPILFKLFDGKTTASIVWKQIKPRAEQAASTFQQPEGAEA